MAVHIVCGATLVGGVLAWRYGAIPAMEKHPEAGDAMAAAWRPFVIAAVVGLLATGLYNMFGRMSSGVPSTWHMVFGIKFLLALHVFAATILATKQKNQKRARQLTGVVFSGLIVIVLAVTLRYLAG